MLFQSISRWIFKKRLSPIGIGLRIIRTPRTKDPGSAEKAFSRASLTAEAAVVVPVFLVCMSLALQYGNVYDCAVRIGSALSRTSEEMAVASYLTEASEDGASGDILGVTISAAYASAQVSSRMGNCKAIRRDSLLLSSFLEHDKRIDLVMTYQVRSPVGIIRVPGSVFLQRGCVRGWTGRDGSSGSGSSGDDSSHSHEMVYVAENGVVYHNDINCTYIRLSISPTSLDQVKNLRNEYGGKYHPCEKCGRHASGVVFITKDGDRYHSSLECSGLKRTISQVSMEEAGHLRPCPRCSGAHSGSHG